jgi:hypothetical protein
MTDRSCLHPAAPLPASLPAADAAHVHDAGWASLRAGRRLFLWSWRDAQAYEMNGIAADDEGDDDDDDAAARGWGGPDPARLVPVGRPLSAALYVSARGVVRMTVLRTGETLEETLPLARGERVTSVSPGLLCGTSRGALWQLQVKRGEILRVPAAPLLGGSAPASTPSEMRVTASLAVPPLDEPL